MSIKIQNNKIYIYNPATSEEVGSVNVSSKKEVDEILYTAKNYNDWSDLTLNKRCKIINKFRKAVFKNKDLVKSTIKKETGKKDFVIFAELLSFLDHAKTMASIAKKALKDSKRKTGLIFKNKKAYVKYEPMGVLGVISPWNFPMGTAMKATIEGLLAGNNIVLKPSEFTPLTIMLIKKIWDENIGYQNAFQVVNGAGEVGSFIVNSNLIDIISFTGSTEVGVQIAEICSKTLKPCILELGGKDPMIVLKDACLKRSVESALHAGLFNSGQTCISTEEVFVERDLFEKFVSKITSRLKDIKSGNSDNDDLGPIITPETRNKINEHINEVKDKCDVYIGDNNGDEKFIAPTIIVNPPTSSRIVNEETFGPVITVRPFDNEDDLFEMVHKTGYGLSSSIFGKDYKRINRLIKKLKIGNVNVNDAMTTYIIPTLPYGGEGMSGLGKQHGKEGLRALCRIKSIVVNRFNFIDEPSWWNRPKIIETILEKIVNVLYR